ncbi:Uncharacterised protein [Yersinia intermedia]|nr:Uncharacterised protein [Yersinia intermedia]CNI62551.1 Uncharacterised protein [Yersinia intermedia]CNJ90399.1 Uncharacterised protein [Yersinia intermedia]CQJ56324.1 Uncharacterised protein [Yersinia intermedia]CRF13248.1 Uncharacterised protein [Yersinia intermedia]
MMAIMFIQALLPLNSRYRLAEIFFKYIPPKEPVGSFYISVSD